ncbi:hypothetical protein [Pseudonocardia sp. H11422]|nr:hypothetical protein [Pseudonocardia sp. H11422]
MAALQDISETLIDHLAVAPPWPAAPDGPAAYRFLRMFTVGHG